jgi:hypothetical protein
VIKNHFYTGLDAFSLYGLLCQYNPKRYIEIGSGNSTKFARQAIKDYQLQTQIISIDPYPRAEIDQLCDQVIREPIEETDLSIFKELEAGDILFIDSSHYVLQNSDVTVMFLEILPFLKPGVLVHIHDVYLPWDYPSHWVERNYSEQYMLALMLLCNASDYEIIFPSYYASESPEFVNFYKENVSEPLQKHVQLEGASIWFRKKN